MWYANTVNKGSHFMDYIIQGGKNTNKIAKDTKNQKQQIQKIQKIIHTNVRAHLQGQTSPTEKNVIVPPIPSIQPKPPIPSIQHIPPKNASTTQKVHTFVIKTAKLNNGTAFLIQTDLKADNHTFRDFTTFIELDKSAYCINYRYVFAWSVDNIACAIYSNNVVEGISNRSNNKKYLKR